MTFFLIFSVFDVQYHRLLAHKLRFCTLILAVLWVIFDHCIISLCSLSLLFTNMSHIGLLMLLIWSWFDILVCIPIGFQSEHVSGAERQNFSLIVQLHLWDSCYRYDPLIW